MSASEILSYYGVDVERLYEGIMDELWADLALIEAAEAVEDDG